MASSADIKRNLILTARAGSVTGCNVAARPGSLKRDLFQHSGWLTYETGKGMILCCCKTKGDGIVAGRVEDVCFVWRKVK